MNLGGVPGTALWTLWQRALEARRAPGLWRALPAVLRADFV